MIVAMRDGVVMETGTHDDLMNRKDVYYKLVMLQTIAEEVESEQDNISVLSNEEKGKDNYQLDSWIIISWIIISWIVASCLRRRQRIRIRKGSMFF